MGRPIHIVNMRGAPIREEGPNAVDEVANQEETSAESQRGGHCVVLPVVASMGGQRKAEYAWSCVAETSAESFVCRFPDDVVVI